MCKATPDCTWFTFQLLFNECLLFEDCLSFGSEHCPVSYFNSKYLFWSFNLLWFKKSNICVFCNLYWVMLYMNYNKKIYIEFVFSKINILLWEGLNSITTKFSSFIPDVFPANYFIKNFNTFKKKIKVSEPISIYSFQIIFLI